jgi:tetratricopeptide (TPR) repeat protein
MKNLLEEMKELCSEEKYDEALAVIEKIESECLLYPEVLVWKGRCLELGDGSNLNDIFDIEKVYRQALAIDDEYVPALLELGGFYLNVLDDAERARPFFEKAFGLLKGAMTEAVDGVARCLWETDTKYAAVTYLTMVTHNLLDERVIRKLNNDIKGDSE